MTDYIDREALIESLKDRYCVKPKCNRMEEEMIQEVNNDTK
jgi:hypothetical protein